MITGKLGRLPHPAVVCSGRQLDSVIREMTAGSMPLPDVCVWRDDLPQEQAVRLARATGATDEQIITLLADELPEGAVIAPWGEIGRRPRDDDGNPKSEFATCGVCHLTWDDAVITSRTPVPAGRCPFEDQHVAEVPHSVVTHDLGTVHYGHNTVLCGAPLGHGAMTDAIAAVTCPACLADVHRPV